MEQSSALSLLPALSPWLSRADPSYFASSAPRPRSIAWPRAASTVNTGTSIHTPTTFIQPSTFTPAPILPDGTSRSSGRPRRSLAWEAATSGGTSAATATDTLASTTPPVTTLNGDGSSSRSRPRSTSPPTRPSEQSSAPRPPTKSRGWSTADESLNGQAPTRSHSGAIDDSVLSTSPVRSQRGKSQHRDLFQDDTLLDTTTLASTSPTTPSLKWPRNSRVRSFSPHADTGTTRTANTAGMSPDDYFQYYDSYTSGSRAIPLPIVHDPTSRPTKSCLRSTSRFGATADIVDVESMSLDDRIALAKTFASQRASESNCMGVRGRGVKDKAKDVFDKSYGSSSAAPTDAQTEQRRTLRFVEGWDEGAKGFEHYGDDSEDWRQIYRTRSRRGESRARQ
ncbi:hypothetical protein EHS25_005281 [Saitozyma podzolica]|uniref:Uncharacterized protein n=1 Tax=Saitozyma podzolica TaxID=1890683 RepID=A0A427XYT1_9TREE|nr:hypothetical protein EHS25_005281 [Saitozyma podzolica]